MSSRGVTSFVLVCMGLLLVSCSKKVTDGVGAKIYDAAGHEFLFAEHKNKYIIVNYWASWCPPCMKEIPELIAFQKEHSDEAVLLGVNLEPLNNQQLLDLIAKLGINYVVTPTDPAPKLQIESPELYPTTVFVNKQGIVKKVHKGVVKQFMLEEFISN